MHSYKDSWNLIQTRTVRSVFGPFNNELHAADLDVSDSALHSLVGCPKYVNGDFNCRGNKLETLEGGPEKVTGLYDCSHNKNLTSLKGCAKKVRDFICTDNPKIRKLTYVPKWVEKSFLVSFNSLETLEGSPQKVHGVYRCDHNNIQSLEGCPKEIYDTFSCSSNKLKSLKDIHKYIRIIKGPFYCLDNPIESHVLGLFLIDGLTKIHHTAKWEPKGSDYSQWAQIVNKHINKSRKGMLACQKELIENGLEEYAQL